jgi:hypothetical protein
MLDHSISLLYEDEAARVQAVEAEGGDPDAVFKRCAEFWVECILTAQHHWSFDQTECVMSEGMLLVSEGRR